MPTTPRCSSNETDSSFFARLGLLSLLSVSERRERRSLKYIPLLVVLSAARLNKVRNFARDIAEEDVLLLAVVVAVGRGGLTPERGSGKKNTAMVAGDGGVE